MTLACLLQIYSLAGQIKQINTEVRSSKRTSISAPPSSLTSTTMSSLDRKAGLRKVLLNVIMTSIALTLSCFGYLASCLGKRRARKGLLLSGWRLTPPLEQRDRPRATRRPYSIGSEVGSRTFTSS